MKYKQLDLDTINFANIEPIPRYLSVNGSDEDLRPIYPMYWMAKGYRREDALIIVEVYMEWRKNSGPFVSDELHRALQEIQAEEAALKEIVLDKDHTPTDNSNRASEVRTPISWAKLAHNYGLDKLDLKNLNTRFVTTIERKSKTAKVQYNLVDVCNFLGWLLNEWNLTIGDYFEAMKTLDSFFLIAATGLGNTVGTPVYLLIKQMMTKLLTSSQDQRNQKSPRVWVVVPTIAIVSESVKGLNQKWFEFLQLNRPTNAKHPTSFLYGGRSSSFKSSFHTPIQFITTGVLPLLASSGELDPDLDIILLDESHKTLTVDESMELALSKLWEQKITVHFMSATVGTNELEKRLRAKIIRADEERFPKYWHLSKQELEYTVKDVINNFHISRNLESDVFPPSSYPYQEDVLQGVDSQGSRASGILVVVDSFNGTASDAVQLRKAIEPMCKRNGIEVLGFSSSIRDDDSRNKVHEKQFNRVIQNKRKYVIITTNVIEMGITWSTLDVVITKDTEIVNEMINGFQVPVKVPISSSALLQRGGRVGRKRPGIVVISTGETSPLYNLSDEELNESGLEIQELQYPLQTKEPRKLAYQLFKADQKSTFSILRYLHSNFYPSIDNTPELGYVMSMTTPLVKMLDKLGLDKPKYRDQILPYYERWVGDPMYPWLVTAARLLIEVMEEHPRIEYRWYETWFTMVYLGFMSTIPTSRIVAKNGKDFDRCRLPYSDLLSVGWKSDIYFDVRLDSSVQFVEDVFAQYSASWKKEKSIQYGLRLFPASKSSVQFYTFFKDLLNVLEDKGWLNEDFYYFFDKGRLSSTEGDDWDNFDPERPYQTAFNIEKDTEYDTYLYYKYLKALNTIYQAIGTRFTIDIDSKHPKAGMYMLTYEYEGEVIHESVDGGYHLVKIDTSKTYWGILMPTTVEDQTQVVLKMEHWFYMPTGIEEPVLNSES